MGDLTEHFSRSEFACKCKCGADNISEELVSKLEIVRQMYGNPMTITSGMRCEKANKAANSSETSSHLIGEAADIGCTNSKARDKLVGFLRTQFSRMGIHRQFVHVDVSDDKKVSPCLWVY